jgi:hypothetical protein
MSDADVAVMASDIGEITVLNLNSAFAALSQPVGFIA